MSKQITILRNETQGQKQELQNTMLMASVSHEATSDYNTQTANLRAGKCIPINPKGEPLNVETFRSFEGCGHYNDEEALGIIESLSTLARIVVATVLKGGTPIDNQQVLHLESNINSNKKAA